MGPLFAYSGSPMPRLPDDVLLEKLLAHSERTVPRYNGVRCLEWQRFTHKGYGRMRDGERKWRVHVLAWTLLRGPVPEGHQVHHHCDIPCCWEESHLWTGTQAENLNDAKTKGRMPEMPPRNWAGRFY